MDLLVVVTVIVVLGIIKVFNSGGFAAEEETVMHEDGSYTISENSIPVGNNLMLKYDSEAFTLILKELGLRK